MNDQELNFVDAHTGFNDIWIHVTRTNFIFDTETILLRHNNNT